MGLKEGKKEGCSKYYYVVYSWEVRGKGSGTGACSITVTHPGVFLISSVARDISEKHARGGTVLIQSWREITEEQAKEFVGTPKPEESEAGTDSLVNPFITRALFRKFGGDKAKTDEWLSTPRKEWLMMDANELIRIGDGSRVLAFLEEEERDWYKSKEGNIST